MKNSNIWTPALLTLIQLLMAIMALYVLMPWLPENIIGIIHLIPIDLAGCIDIFDKDAHSIGIERLHTEMATLSVSGWVWTWMSISAAIGTLLSWFVQMLISGLQPRWRYLLGVSVFIFIWTGVSWISAQAGISRTGQIFGFIFGQFFGWWAAVGYRRTDQRYTDARNVRHEFGKMKPFDPVRFINLKKGVFVGLNKYGQPRYITVSDSRKHVELMGETRYGKTVAATLLQAQAMLLRETVIVLDPKADKHSPSVLKAAAERAALPFIYIDLRPDQPPQLNILSGAAEHDIEELLISCFDLGAKGTDADVYRVEDRSAARKLARSDANTFNEMLLVGAKDESIHGARKFWEDLQELASHPAIQTSEGWKLEELIGVPCVIYIVGSTRHDNTIRLQKLVLLRLLQIIDQYGSKIDSNWTSVFLDEFKYVLCPAALRALGTIADRNCHLTIAHQSLGDLRDVEGLDPGAVYGAVVVNTGLKLFYKTNDPDTARWGADLSGDIPTYTESFAKNPATPNPGSFQEKQRPLFEKNVLLALPPLTGVLFGAGVAEQVTVHYLPKSQTPPQVTAAKHEVTTEFAEELI